jgi:predicted RNA-binding protein YlxR (DUF448 family)/ribosomal protein L7Ae-like RNA K-turn-binding protein
VDVETVKDSERTCVGCRQKAAPAALVRLAVADVPPFIAPDVTRRGGHARGGRGLWVHPNLRCVRTAADRGGLSRALKREMRVESGWLAGVMRDAIVRRVEGLLLSASRKHALALGTEATREAVARGSLEALVVAEDAAGRRDDLLASASRLGRNALVFSTKGALGRLFGRDEVGVIGILDRGIAAEVVESGQRLVDLSEAE